MKYNNLGIQVPGEKREDINNKILLIVEGKATGHSITREDIFNSYTGRGGLHGLNASDFDNYYEFSNAKKAFEQGQFFTPPEICREMVDLVRPGKSDLVCDPTCGSGNFFNFLPVEQNCYGCELEQGAARVAKYLYPEATIIQKDIRSYNPGVTFDFIFGNPPFNLDFGYCTSQLYFCRKAGELLKPGGLLVIITPLSFLKDEFSDRGTIYEIDKAFNFVLQYKLDPGAFKSLGVDLFPTRVIILQKKSRHLEDRGYRHDFFVQGDSESIHHDYILPLLEKNRQSKAKLILESRKEKGSFDYTINKLLYQIKIHRVTAPFYARCQGKVARYRNQEKPADMDYEEWHRVSLTPKKVISYLKRVLARQHKQETDRISFVKRNYTIAVKSYSRKAKAQLNKNQEQSEWTLNELVSTGSLPACQLPGITLPKGIKNLIEKKRREFLHQETPFDTMARNQKIDAYLEDFRFKGKDGSKCGFNEIQKKDLGLCIQKKYSLLNWQMGSGKTAASYAWAKYNMKNCNAKNIFVVSAAISINLTWVPFMKKQEQGNFILLEKMADIKKIKPGMFVLVTLSRLTGKTVKGKIENYQVKQYKFLRDYIKRQAFKVGLIFDESDEITNPNSKRSKAVLSCFRKAKYKLLATGTTTRNNITELYKQMELLYNNSINLLCTCPTIYSEVKGKEEVTIHDKVNKDYFNKPFPAFYGNNLFKACFNPSKTTVFGIKKHNQDIFNKDSLIRLIKKTILTRLFKEIAGPGKYEIKSHIMTQNRTEVMLYGKIISELQSMIARYFESTGNDKKDNMLKIIRQLNLLIKATSTPHTFQEYRDALPPAFPEELQKYPLFKNRNQTIFPNKYKYIENMVAERSNTLVAVGCTTHDAANMYYDNLSKKFPGRKVFLCTGHIPFRSRNKVIKEFEATENGILIATQQSLKSSVNIPTCNEIIIEALPWNVSKLLQYCFRFIRYDSKEKSTIHIINYKDTIDMNLFALLLAKERVNDFIKTLEYKDQSEIYGEFDVNTDILNSILSKSRDREGKVRIEWGMQKVS